MSRFDPRRWTASDSDSGPSARRRRTARSRRAASARPGSGSGGRPRGRCTSAGTRRDCPRRAAAGRPIPFEQIGEPASMGHGGVTVYHPGHASLERAGRARRRHHAHLREDGPARRLLPDLAPDELPIAAVFLTGRPFPEADQRAAGLGWAAIGTTVTDLAGQPDPRSPRPTTARRTWDGRRRRPVGRRPRAGPGPLADATEVAAAYAAIETASGPAASRRSCATSSPGPTR